MKYLFVLFLILLANNKLVSQIDSIRVYDWNEVSKADPDSILGLSFSKLKLTYLPTELANFKNLKILDLSKNKLTELPDFIGDFSQLELLDISKNALNIFPIEICKLSKIRILIANRNTFDKIPECIGYCLDLERIDLWDTPVMSFPNSIVDLKKLNEIDLQGVKYGPTFQSNFQKKIPRVKVLFDSPCDCME